MSIRNVKSGHHKPPHSLDYQIKLLPREGRKGREHTPRSQQGKRKRLVQILSLYFYKSLRANYSVLECFGLYFRHFINKVSRFCTFCLTIDILKHKQTKEYRNPAGINKLIFFCVFKTETKHTPHVEGCLCPFANVMCRLYIIRGCSAVGFFLHLAVFLC